MNEKFWRKFLNGLARRKHARPVNVGESRKLLSLPKSLEGVRPAAKLSRTFCKCGVMIWCFPGEERICRSCLFKRLNRFTEG